MSAKFNNKTEKILQEENRSYVANISPQALTTKYIPGSTRKYSYNPNGICGSTAAIFLMYYNDYVTD